MVCRAGPLAPIMCRSASSLPGMERVSRCAFGPVVYLILKRLVVAIVSEGCCVASQALTAFLCRRTGVFLTKKCAVVLTNTITCLPRWKRRDFDAFKPVYDCSSLTGDLAGRRSFIEFNNNTDLMT